MEWVKSVFGVALLALAASYLRDAFPALRSALQAAGAALGVTRGLLLVTVLAFGGVALGAVHRSFKQAGDWIPKAAGVAALLVAFLIRMALPTEGVPAAGEPGYHWAMVYKADAARSAAPFEQALAQAKAECRPVLIDFFADWCAACKELDAKTYVDGEVVEESRRFVSIKVDGTEDHEVLDGLYRRFGVQGLPTVAFVDPTGLVLDSPRVTGYLPPGKFLGEMRKVALKTCGNN